MRALVAAAALSLAATGLGACSRNHAELSLVDVKRADLVIGVEVNGELAAVDSLDIKPPPLYDTWDFKIANLAPEGSEVKQGEPVVAFDPSEQMRNLESLQNDADAAKKKLDKKRDDAALARRNEELEIAEAEAGVRKALLNDYGIEIGAGLGPMKGKIWRVGLMGETSKPENVEKVLGALKALLKK